MMPPAHIAISAAAGGAVAYWTKSPAAGWACLISGVFIDLDHHLDYFLAKKKIPWSYKELVRYCETDKEGRLYLIGHGYESLLALWIAIYVFSLGAVWFGAAIGLTLHVICDQLVNPLKPLGYFYWYRFKQGFRRDKLFQPDHYYEKIH